MVRLLLELARFLPRPALYNNFGLGEELDSVFALPMKNAEEAFLPSAERKVRHRRGNSDIDTDIPRGRFISKFARRRAARRKKRSLIPVRAALQEFHRFIDRIRVHEAQHGPENLGVRELAVH